ncbi:MAG: UDP-N-acetylmuramoyl-L-alanyl-D-glutamate--2,6-diaminopimelate ligase [Gammaproteobacteria bacterium]|nr:UDP-N-acetylmuramoyl-L-alanyl-D-glutamate--2,6-diaminopimelate ligase [Gammaproteobacteria bacterium]
MTTPSHQVYYSRLSELLHGVDVVSAFVDVGFCGMTMDSRRVEPGYLFVAIKGMATDGHDYIETALERGAVAVLTEEERPELKDMPVVVVRQLRDQLGMLADRFYRSPSRDMKIIGVTGTNGKTTCTYLTSQALNNCGERCGLIGTMGIGYPGNLEDSGHTTPDVISVHRVLAKFRDDGCSHVCMEVSSHALDQGRVSAVDFDIAVFTNLSRDHLDYHGSMERYGRAKQSLFHYPELDCAIVNEEDEFSEQIAQAFLARDHNHPEQLLTYGFDHARVCVRHYRVRKDGFDMTIGHGDDEIDVSCNMLGRFNASNVLAVVAILLCIGRPLSSLPAVLSALKPAAGRMEIFHGPDSPVVVVDYAHTPDALEKALQALREHVSGEVWCVFGCGGDRDKGKRPLMGEIAGRVADRVVLTDDNPRFENAKSIIEDILAGLSGQAEVIQPREQAISTAISAANPGDIVLVAGKGHETYQEVAGERNFYSDRETVERLLEVAV